jgi:ATP-dependent DNA helicase RecQ
MDILLGKEDSRIESNGHNKLAVFGLGKELSGPDWRSLYRQLIAMAYLSVDVDGHGALKLAEKCRPVLRGEQRLRLRKQATPEKISRRGKKESNADIRSVDMPLFEALRALRLKLSQEQGVPPYVIFHDSTLVDITSKRPEAEEQFRYISGVGEKKLQRYGSDFMAVVAEHALPDSLNNSLSDTVNATLLMFEEGASFEDIAKRREKPIDTVFVHIAEVISEGLLSIDEVVDLDEDEFHRILSMMELMEGEAKGKLQPIFEALEGEYDLGILRCVQASIGQS